jgi:putative transposase
MSALVELTYTFNVALAFELVASTRNSRLPDAYSAKGVARKKVVTVAERRDAVGFLHSRGLSVQRACQLVGLHRSTYHYQACPDQNTDLLNRIQKLAQRHPRYGYRRICALLRREQKVNKKRVQRLWQQARLQVRKHRRKRRRIGGGSVPLQASYPGHVWTYDFIYDACRNCTQLKILTVMDEFTREGLAIEVATSLPSKRVIAVLAQLFASHGAPAYLCSDNGPEFIAQALRMWLAQHQTATWYIDPGCLWQKMPLARASTARYAMSACRCSCSRVSPRPVSCWKPIGGTTTMSARIAVWGIEPRPSSSVPG